MGELYDQFLNRDDLTAYKWHHYFPVYETYMQKYRDTAPKMLEIGVWRGGSARMFADWLGAGTHITGVDVDPSCAAYSVPGIDILIGDQSDRAFLAQLAAEHGPWDIILDDGGHTDRQILTSFEVLFPHLKDGGVYLIEDTHAHWLASSFRDHPKGHNIVHLVAELFSEMHRWTGNAQKFEAWHVPPPDRKAPTPAPYFTSHVAGVHLFDSLVVIDKQQREEPFVEIREAGKPRTTTYRIRDY